MSKQVLSAHISKEFEIDRKKCLDSLKASLTTGQQALRELVRKYPTVAEAHHLLAATDEQIPPKEETLTHALMAARLAPRKFEYVFLLAILYYQLGLYEMAVPVFREAILLNSQSFAAYHLLAQCLQNMGMGDEAIANFEFALACKPKPSERLEVMMELANAASTSNRPELALEIYVEIAKTKSRFRNQAIALAGWNSKPDQSSSHARAIEIALARKDVTSVERAELLLAKGKLLDGQGRHDEAFQAWAGARKQSQKNSWHIKDHVEEFNLRAQFYSKERCSMLDRLPSAKKRLSVICGMPRSGTTLTEQIISAHPDAAGIGEFGRWNRLDNYVREHLLKNPVGQGDAANKIIASLAELSEDTHKIMVEIVGTEPPLIVEKLPHNFMYAGLIRMLFPQTRFIHIRRHPLDSFISSYQSPLNSSHGYAYDQVEYAKEFLFHERLMTHWKSLFPDQIYTVHYEELALNPEKQARALLEFVGLPWTDSVLEFYKSDRTVRTISKDQVRNPVYTKSIGRWKRYEKHLGPIKQALSDAGFSYPDFA
jgi:tetratricopeptide (TPR) repeat protein